MWKRAEPGYEVTMSLVGRVGRRSFRARFALSVLYVCLSLGAATTLFPFLLMISTGLKGPTDQNDNKLVPAYFGTMGLDQTNWTKPDTSLLGKYLDDKYQGDPSAIQSTRIGAKASSETVRAYEEFLAKLPEDLWMAGFRQAGGQVTSKVTMRYQSWVRDRYKDIQTLNEAYTEENLAFNTVPPPGELLDRRAWVVSDGVKYRDYVEFKRSLPVEYRIPVRPTRIWQQFMSGKFEGQFARVPAAERGIATKFEELQLPKSGALLAEFVATRMPPKLLKDNAETRWAALGLGEMPIDAYERGFVAANASALKNEFAGRNFRYVIDYVLLNGRAVLNTVLFCAFVILAQLTVNPLAAYAISRYPVRATSKILIFLLATMAFPAEVAMIPSFLMLKQFGMLNTFWALVLPTAASGYMIYLLKGFFDSLPQELFESGQIDGAKELTMLWKIALPLSRPVLGYLALLAFMHAYGAFIFAFLIAQDRKMWTLMVSMYQLQLVAPKAVVMAGLTLTALPTLIVFLLAQRVIMRGIVLPGER